MTKDINAVSNLIRKVTIDINQAGEYYENSQYDGYRKNLDDCLNNISNLIKLID